VPLGSQCATPGILLDANDRPHLVYARAIPNGTTSFPSDVVHEWHDGAAWRRETIAQARTFAPSNEGPQLAFALASDGTPVVAWRLWEPYGQLEAARRDGSGWSVEALTSDLYDTTYGLMDVRPDPGGTIHLGAWSGPRLLVWSRPEDGSWSPEIAFTTARTIDKGMILPRADGVTLAYEYFEPLATYPMKLAGLTEADGSWGSPVELGAHGSTVGLPWAGASGGTRVAFVVPQDQPNGLLLHARDGEAEWVTLRLRQTTGTVRSWVGFDGTGHLLVLGHAGPAPGGMVSYVLYVER
jgi:hypothetical protein